MQDNSGTLYATILSHIQRRLYNDSCYLAPRRLHVLVIEQPKAEGNTILVKVLNSRGEPEPDNVCVLRRIGKDEGTYYHFEYLGEMPEKEALQGELTGEDDSDPRQTKEDPKLVQAREMKAYLKDHTQDETATFFNCSRQTVVNRLKLLAERNEG